MGNRIKNYHYISLEGNIGAGKSTFLRKLSKLISIFTILEPHEKWQNIDGNNLLDFFYSDINRWAYTFQSYAFLTRIQAIEEALVNNNSSLFITERSILADYYIFTTLCHEYKAINDLELSLYRSWYQWMTTKHCYTPHGIIYLRVSPDIAYSRINKRKRIEEKNISYEYLCRLYQKHEEWLVLKQYSKDMIPVLIIDANDDFEDNDKIWEKNISLINNFLGTIIKRNNIYTIKRESFYGCSTGCGRNNYCQ